MTNPLKDDFASFAEHALVPDMHAKVLVRSRWLGIRRAVASGVAALAVMVGGVTGAFAVVDHLPDEVESAAPLTGTFYYLDRGGAQGATRVLSWSPGQEAPTVVLEGDDTIRSTATVSPDGRYIAWREPVGGNTASLMLKELATGRVTTLMDEFQYLPCAEPVWTPDSTRLLVGRQPLGDGQGVSASYVDIDEPQAFGDSVEIPGCHPRFVAEGEHAGEIVYWLDSGPEAMTPDGSEPTVDTRGLQDGVMEAVGRIPSNLVTISADGARACLSTDAPTTDRTPACDAVIEVPGGAVVMISADFSASFLLTGDLVVKRLGGVMTVYDAAGADLGTIIEPPLGDGAELLSYAD